MSESLGGDLAQVIAELRAYADDWITSVTRERLEAWADRLEAHQRHETQYREDRGFVQAALLAQIHKLNAASSLGSTHAPPECYAREDVRRAMKDGFFAGVRAGHGHETMDRLWEESSLRQAFDAAAACPPVSPVPQPVDVNALIALLLSMDDWLGNSKGLMIEDVVDWREQLAKGLGVPERGTKAASPAPAPSPIGPSSQELDAAVNAAKHLGWNSDDVTLAGWIVLKVGPAFQRVASPAPSPAQEA